MSDAAPPLFLACDTTQGACSAALYRASSNANKASVLASEVLPMTKGHAEALLPMLARVCATAKIDMQEIDRLAVTHGPGTFTGVRVGLSAMRGLSLALAIPLKAYGTLEVMAQASEAKTPLIVAVDARRSVFYAQSFDAAKTPLTPPQALTAEQVFALVETGAVGLLGSGADPLLASLKNPESSRFSAENGLDYPQAEKLAALAAADLDWPAYDAHACQPEPLYLRAPDASLPNPDKFPRRAPTPDA
ncbi:MAG: tRNA (adenosine(37)-N6)-threonylcarbamoyltransferase complex dimerization subunit type 1 TsaB [Rhodobiaceae bacterium]|nr:tRNA (adenosine(37)-N6)-threonylcarbamoyltransferase complex dimerization subunit type 1 TsaB [Rhodobiaceae bacterium]